jgi:hypothetical protein
MSAIFSEDRIYRYALWREWPMLDGEERQGSGCERAYALFIGLNPSTADEVKDDPTIRRCKAFAKSWGYGHMCMTNLFAFRATNPNEMIAAVDPIGPDNDEWLNRLAKDAWVLVAAWGEHGKHRGRATEIVARFPNLKCFGINKNGSPKHPLYLPKTSELRKLTI